MSDTFNGTTTIICDDGTEYTWNPYMGQGVATPITEAESEMDEHGLTNPNLHRRIDVEEVRPGELAPREYQLSVNGVMSYRAVKYECHDEESTTNEIP